MIFTQIGTPFFLWGGSSGTHCIHFYFNTRRLYYLNRGEIENSQSLARRSCDFVQLTVKFLQGNSAGVVNTYIHKFESNSTKLFCDWIKKHEILFLFYNIDLITR
jgi:hypothetical protein